MIKKLIKGISAILGLSVSANVRYMQLGVCSRCKRLRPIYQVEKQLCSSCRVLEKFDKDSKKYEEFLRKQRESNKLHPEKKKETNDRYYFKNADKIRAYGRQYFQDNKERMYEAKKKWVAKNPEKVKGYKIKSFLNNPEKVIASRKKWIAEHPEKIRGYGQNWRNSPRGIEWRKKYYSQPEVKERLKAYRNKPQFKAQLKLYQQRPEVKARIKIWRDKPENKEKKRKYDEQYVIIKKLKRIERKKENENKR